MITNQTHKLSQAQLELCFIKAKKKDARTQKLTGVLRRKELFEMIIRCA